MSWKVGMGAGGRVHHRRARAAFRRTLRGRTNAAAGVRDLPRFAETHPRVDRIRLADPAASSSRSGSRWRSTARPGRRARRRPRQAQLPLDRLRPHAGSFARASAGEPADPAVASNRDRSPRGARSPTCSPARRPARRAGSSVRWPRHPRREGEVFSGPEASELEVGLELLMERGARRVPVAARPPRFDAAGGARRPQCEGPPGLSPSEGPFRTSRASG